MAKSIGHKSVKHEIVDRDNTRIVASVAVAVFLAVFCGFAMRTLFSQSLYHNRVIGEKKTTLGQLEDNINALESLEESYRAFVEAPENILTGNPDGEGKLSGRNDTLVLDSLPEKYDYPGLASSFEKILIDGGYEVSSIGGTEIRSTLPEATADAKPIELPFDFAFISTLDGTKQLLETLESSIRPMQVNQLGMTIGKGGQISAKVSLHTFYTQQKAYELGKKKVE